jgi:microcystin-dependent protein
MTSPFVGEIRMFGGNFAPTGWALCNGQLLPISQNSALFSILGTTYGGNGTSNFALPNMQARTPLHWGQAPGLSLYDLGEQTGTSAVTLLLSEIPQHNHLVNASQGFTADSNSPLGNYPAYGNNGNIYGKGATSATFTPTAVIPTGGNIPHNNLQPYLVVTFIIALQGVYPARN